MCLDWYLQPVFKECVLHVSFILGAFKCRNVLFRLLFCSSEGVAQMSTVESCCDCGGPGLLSVPVLEETADLGQNPGPAAVELFRIASLRIIFLLSRKDL